MSALEGISSSSSSPRGDRHIDALEALVNELQGTISDIVDDCSNSMKAIRHEVGELSAKLNLIIQVVGNQSMPAWEGIEFTGVKVPKPRHYGGAYDTKEVENFLFDIE